VSWLSVALLACAVLVLVGAEWPRLSARFGVEARRKRERERRKQNLRVLRTDQVDDSEEFAASVQRDLSRLPTTEEEHRH
jgi:hypothetical protein